MRLNNLLSLCGKLHFVVFSFQATCDKRSYLCGLEDEVVDDDLLLIGEAQSVLTDECDSEGDAVHGLLPTRPVNKFILSLQKNQPQVKQDMFQVHFFKSLNFLYSLQI